MSVGIDSEVLGVGTTVGEELSGKPDELDEVNICDEVGGVTEEDESTVVVMTEILVEMEGGLSDIGDVGPAAADEEEDGREFGGSGNSWLRQVSLVALMPIFLTYEYMI